MGFRTFLFIYVLGGLTFLPLLAFAAWRLLPRATIEEKDAGYDDWGSVDAKSEDAPTENGRDRNRDSVSDAGASGSFAVLRRYDLQAALTALGSKTGANPNGNGDNSSNGAEGDSVSVYQSMYRSVFTGSKPNSSTSSLLQKEDTEPGIRRKPAPANVLYIVLRHGHLMVYDSPAQVEVKHVISLANHYVSLQSGTVNDEDMDERKIPESDLFIKRTAIVLTPVELPSGALQQASTVPPKPFYLFSATNIEKEAFYHALLAARINPPTPRPLDTDALIKLQSMLHSSSMTPEARALNAIVGRVFLAIHHTDAINDFIRYKIEKKIARIQKPTFIPSLRIQSLNLGDAGPVISNFKMRDLNISGDMTVSADMKYTGGLSITFLAVARLDLGPRFKVRSVDLVLKTTIKRISGSMLLHIKPPPSNRMWVTFETVPEMEIRVEPVVSERKITYGFVLRAIEERVRTAIAEGLVKPNWDDIPYPFTDTRGSHARGGLWRHEGEPDSNQSTQAEDKTVPIRESQSGVDVAASTGISKSSTMPIDEASMRRRTAESSEGVNGHGASPERNQQSSSSPRLLRSPSLSSSIPSVAVDGQNVEPVRNDDTSLPAASAPNRKLWRPRGSPNAQQPRDALEELRDLRDRAEKAASSPRNGSASEVQDAENDIPHTPAETGTESVIGSRRPSDGSVPSPSARTFSIQSADSERSTTSSLSSSQSAQSQSKKANVLAATVAATNAARNWGWNTLQRNKSVFPRPGVKQEPSTPVADQPMGRGQPLPPPGVPLPGPQPKTLWGNMKRKPVPNLPARRPVADATQRVKEDQLPRDSEEFEPWQENSGPVESQDFATMPKDDSDVDASTPDQGATPSNNELKVPAADHDRPDLSRKSSREGSKIPVKAGRTPPPLPRRPSPVHGRSSQSFTPSRSSRTETEEGLKVPEIAVDAVAAENATPDLAHGATDVPTIVDESGGIEADIAPDGDDESADLTRSLRNNSGEDENRQFSKSSTGHDELDMQSAGEAMTNFAHSEDVDEEDLEHIGQPDFKTDRKIDLDSTVLSSKQGQSIRDTSTPQTQSEEDRMAERVRARIQHHTQGNDGPAGGGKNQQ